MALIQCPECKKEISDQAETCIYCGYPIKSKTVQPTSIKEEKKKDGIGFWGIVFAVIVGILIVSFC